jgi:hypothetical protein
MTRLFRRALLSEVEALWLTERWWVVAYDHSPSVGTVALMERVA